jgi:hypothetical protein
MDYQCLFADDIDPDARHEPISKAIFYSEEQEAPERPSYSLPVQLLQLSHIIENVRSPSLPDAPQVYLHFEQNAHSIVLEGVPEGSVVDADQVEKELSIRDVGRHAKFRLM